MSGAGHGRMDKLGDTPRVAAEFEAKNCEFQNMCI
jgi:hypothetical protein